MSNFAHLDQLRRRYYTQAPVVFLVTDELGIVQEFDGNTQFFFLDDRTVTGQSFRAVLPATIATELGRMLVRINSEGRRVSVVLPQVPLAGERCAVRVTGWRMPGVYQTLLGFSLERLAAEKGPDTPKPTEAKPTAEPGQVYHFMRDVNEIGVATLDLKGRFTEVNAGFVRTLGYQESDLLGQHVSGILFPENEAEMLAYLFDIFRAQGRGNRECQLRHRDGQALYVQVYLEVFQPSDGALQMMFGMLDISLRKQAERQLHRWLDSERILRAVSTTLIQSAGEAPDEVMAYALQQIGKFAEADRVYLGLVTGRRLHLKHEWRASGIKSVMTDAAIGPEDFPWLARQLPRGNALRFDTLDELPAEAAEERRYFERQGTRALMLIPMLRDGKFIGVIGTEQVRKARPWEEEAFFLARLVCELLANALRRQHLKERRARQHEYLQEILDTSPNLILVRTATGDYNVANQVALDFFEGVLPVELDEYDRQVLDRKQTVTCTLTTTTSAGKARTLVCTKKPLRTAEGHWNVLTIGEEVTEQKKYEENLQAALQEKDVLLKEIHHRVKNNMSIISGLLSLQSSYVTDENTQRLFQESQNRIKSMALIHEKLYQSDTLSRIDFAAYLRELVNGIVGYYRLNKDIQVAVEAEPVFVDINLAVPCGLIVNELISNAFKHAFEGRQQGRIRVAFHREKQGYALKVSDNGIGMREVPPKESTQSLGTTLIYALTAQLNADMDIITDEGTTYVIRFTEKVKRVRRPSAV
ncbi:PAS domain S-box-containing protein [Catalinimonas alkaloidigena]|uniref:histidine kinase n=1 Tax=Catalinimonas alkaloidigena TaxID=1075417 RepID=A0A1G9P965_9BACT|nr:histidine kinase dimerization/phosphoacceptor domain -containing protein [Catalinimonas alkaloidigena]SDL95041.1 PAS domain S-box-containing protein [Catalinimonas alkaloidigena]